MGAKAITNKNACRVELGKVLPLKAPFSVQMYVANVCNFKCSYCLQSSDAETLKSMSFQKKLMSLEVYKKCIDGFKALKTRLKVLVLVGWGEPLLHPDIIEMVRYAKSNNIADKIEILSNASLLKPAVADRLIEAGLDSLRISIQGLNSGDYKQVSGVDIDFNEFISNLKYFYHNKKSTNVYMKIMDIMLKNNEDREEFFRLFGELCDEIAVESLIPVLNEFDYTEFGSDFSTELMGNRIVDTDICALPFYSCIIDVDGLVLPCCVFPPPAVFGSAAERGLDSIWNGKEYNSFLIKLLQHKKAQMPVCKQCQRHTHVMRPSDYLDKYAQELEERYKLIPPHA
ncbi:radical SAM protein with 4Fe4S-binding SPASM domain [Anaerobacterium chartisolvens]|uniref:Radical SAM protein with 4Fe4S-binding SPASM domain n=1 Tax=Anaerobacterium chartisolvens TaxID=1297424 RepID=A0A369B8M4_9FIRM|nr:radical SAM protein [Anaerobacterium chartisolvens]RCX16887.1 radical SAM protein with 4Fe4S-binding SPASM domain [Anaerobacterium chartisolvens]